MQSTIPEELLAMNILVVDDLADNRNAITTLLMANGFGNLLEAASGAEVFRLLDSGREIDLVLLDIRMPGIDGHQILDHMKSIDRLKTIPVIMVTAVDDVDSMIECIEHGADDYLVKPVDEFLMQQRLRTALLKRTIHKISFALTILIVDDLADNRNAITTLLAANGFDNVLEAASGAEALRLLDSGPEIDLVLLDIRMPGMDGHQILDRMKSRAELNKIPVIMVTAVNDVESVFECIGNGADDYLVKPVEEVLLRERLRTALVKRTIRRIGKVRTKSDVAPRAS